MSTLDLSLVVLAGACVAAYLAVDGIEDAVLTWAARITARNRPPPR